MGTPQRLGRAKKMQRMQPGQCLACQAFLGPRVQPAALSIPYASFKQGLQ